MYVCMSLCMYVCTYICIYVCMYIYIYVYMYIYIYMRIYMHAIRTCVRPCVYVWICMCVYVNTYVPMWVYTRTLVYHRWTFFVGRLIAKSATRLHLFVAVSHLHACTQSSAAKGKQRNTVRCCTMCLLNTDSTRAEVNSGDSSRCACFNSGNNFHTKKFSNNFKFIFF
jgi:hypothetical protein